MRKRGASIFVDHLQKIWSKKRWNAVICGKIFYKLAADPSSLWRATPRQAKRRLPQIFSPADVAGLKLPSLRD
jgi:hypothetical protein